MNNETRCPYCNSRRTVLNGSGNGKQTYLCKYCKRRWRDGGALGRHRFPPDQIGTGIHKYYTGFSFRRAAKAVEERFGLEDTRITPRTIRKWVHKYTCAAVKLTKGYQPVGGGVWWLCSQPLFYKGVMWWMILDDATGYILGSHVAVRRTADGAREVLLKAMAAAARPCVQVGYLRVWPEANWMYHYIPERTVLEVLREIWPDEGMVKATGGNAPFPSGPVVTRILTAYQSIPERFDRVWVDDDLRRYIDGWMITMNLCTKHEELRRRTPGQAAGVKAPVTDWADVVRMEAQAYLPHADT